MKKLMIAAAIVCAAALSQAATIQWNATTIKLPGTDGKYSGTTASTKGSVTGYLYDISGEQYSTWLTALNTTDWEAQQAAMKTIYDTVTTSATLVNTGDNSGNTKGNVSITDMRDVSTAAVKAIDLYSAIIYTYTDANDKNWFVANVGTQHFELDADSALGTLNTKVGGLGANQAIQGWTTAAVPEPTSGLLLLLGVAGLALRRRRA